MVIQSKSLDEITKLAEEKEKLLAAIPAIQPINNEELTRMASGLWMAFRSFYQGKKNALGYGFYGS